MTFLERDLILEKYVFVNLSVTLWPNFFSYPRIYPGITIAWYYSMTPLSFQWTVYTIEEGRDRQVTSYLRHVHSWSDCTGGGSCQYNHIPVLKCGCTGKTIATRAVWSAESYWRRYDVSNLPVTLYIKLITLWYIPLVEKSDYSQRKYCSGQRWRRNIKIDTLLNFQKTFLISIQFFANILNIKYQKPNT